jgi:hypothetical protein
MTGAWKRFQKLNKGLPVLRYSSFPIGCLALYCAMDAVKFLTAANMKTGPEYTLTTTTARHEDISSLILY